MQELEVKFFEALGFLEILQYGGKVRLTLGRGDVEAEESFPGLGCELLMLIEFEVEEFAAVKEGVFEFKSGFGGVLDGRSIKLSLQVIDFGL